jgi:hypothetical protein
MYVLRVYVHVVDYYVRTKGVRTSSVCTAASVNDQSTLIYPLVMEMFFWLISFCTYAVLAGPY